MATDGTTFNPTRTFYILQHNRRCKDVDVVDLTAEINIPLTGGYISSGTREAARRLAEDKAQIAKPVYLFSRKSVQSWTGSLTSPASSNPDEEIASWKDTPPMCKAKATFPRGSPHCTHAFSMKSEINSSNYTNAFVKDSIEYVFKCDDVLRPCHVSLLKSVGGREVVVAKYAQRWVSGMTAGGVLLVDVEQVDEVIAVLAMFLMLRTLEWRGQMDFGVR